jgi:hypothetical protein
MKHFIFAILFFGTLGFAQYEDYERVGSFYFAEINDVMTDLYRSVIFAEELNPPGGRNGILRLLCEGELYVGLYADEFLASEEYQGFQYRFDKLEPVIVTGTLTNAGTELLIDSVDAETFAAGVKQAQQVAIRTYDYNDIEYTYLFDISDSSAALGKLNCLN